MHSYVLETDRLILRALSPDDAENAFVWQSDPLVNRYMRYTLYTDVEDTRKWLASVQDSIHDFGVVRKADGLLIGSAGAAPADDPAFWELGYNFRHDCWNQGYATEASRALLRYARDPHGIHDFVAGHAVQNPASGRVMEKCGFIYNHDGNYARFDGSETFDCRFYTLHLD